MSGEDGDKVRTWTSPSEGVICARFESRGRRITRAMIQDFYSFGLTVNLWQIHAQPAQTARQTKTNEYLNRDSSR